jgi:hypothetical protein
MGENLPDDDGVLDRGDHTHAAATAGAGEHVHRKRVTQQLRFASDHFGVAADFRT